MISEKCCDMKLYLSPTNDLGTKVFIVEYSRPSHECHELERTSLISNCHELECNLEIASASPDGNTRDDFTNDQFIESILQIEADCRIETGIKNSRGSYSSTIPVNQESVDRDTSIDDSMHFDGVIRLFVPLSTSYTAFSDSLAHSYGGVGFALFQKENMGITIMDGVWTFPIGREK
ncbi:hypothetical protein SADUNF_Sadunf02G0058100 [Salix dunnii]|uniref:Uncharacterized protein n=1 Tax=Salix dunnii TaxID=1413687 RepID=A0A835N6C9_9ROSI|nr:hypothetical protein SADUNF_Sadunf02G0058100 [Salix dunnii]